MPNPRRDPVYLGAFGDKDPPRGKEDGDTCVAKSQYKVGVWEMWCWGFTGMRHKPEDWIYCGEGSKDEMVKVAKDAVTL